MARANANDAAKAPGTAVDTTAATPGETAQGTTAPAIGPGVQGGSMAPDNASLAGAGTGPLQPTDPANGIGSTVQAAQPAAAAVSTDADAAAVGTATTSPDVKSSTGEGTEAAVVAEDSTEITIYPLRSYLDGKEIRRAGGKPYKSPKHDAVSLIAAGLATDKQPKS